MFFQKALLKANSGYELLSFSVYKPGSQFIYTLDEIEYDKFSTIFKKIGEEDSNEVNPLQTSFLRHYTMELILNGQKLQPSASYINRRNTAEVVACSFIRLFENQFPIDELTKTIGIKTPGEFAEALHLHPVYLNRQVKKAKRRTMSDFIASRVLQEAKILLRTTTWIISEIASVLAFEEASHFNTFFRKHTEVTPSEYRDSKV
ncbi:helix-turn-helix domain-containing protein [Chryseobacterium sp. 2R14A]|uniref:helix-turn-helix domain-containing protein n=1 Tax=Chryseobacterium sp. 2R14A TaxID=3380353 RepID=UPI003CFA6964